MWRARRRPNLNKHFLIGQSMAVGVLEDVVGELYFLESAGCFGAVDFVGAGGELMRQ